MIKASPFLAFLLIFSSPALADPPRLTGTPEQGGIVVGQTAAGSRVFLDDTAVPVDAAGHFLLGFGRAAPRRAALKVVARSGAESLLRLEVKTRDWPVQRIDGLPRDKVTPPPALLARIAADNRAIAAARMQIGKRADFLSGFVTPAAGVVSGVFGSQRVLNGEAKAPHSGLDIAANTGTAVLAASDGVVSLVHADMFYTGRTLMIDHGLGLQTVYAHLSRIDVKPGLRVRRGQVIGAVGASGRATGPHLHWGVSWLDRRLDPERLTAILPPTTLGSGPIKLLSGRSAADSLMGGRTPSMSDLFWLSERQLAKIEPHFPLSHGVPRVDDRRVISGIVHMIRNGLRWRDAPPVYGPHKTLYNRFVRWSRLGAFSRIFAALTGEAGPPDRLMIDATHLKAHRTAASLYKKGLFPDVSDAQKAG